MAATLQRFRVTKFRSVKDSGWVDAPRLTTFIGTNESGKTNLLIPLWKLRPANDEPIDPLADYPRKIYHQYSATKGREVFIHADFCLDEDERTKVSTLLGVLPQQAATVRLSRAFNGKYFVELPKCQLEQVPAQEIESVIQECANNVGSKFEELNLTEQEGTEISGEILAAASLLEGKTQVDAECADELVTQLSASMKPYWRKKKLSEQLSALEDTLRKLTNSFSESTPEIDDEAMQKIIDMLPYFIYYANYGNLDSEIYLPHVIANMARTGLGEREKAQARTLKVLFEFVSLSPKQIQELGKQANNADADVIAAESKKKREREILLQSASQTLTSRFKDWWKQGVYKFRLQADGDYFRIWVSDENRPEEVELEGRSTGLQWFFSFFLVFLVESQDSHSECILLLDEPGLSLHPVAQKDLIRFFTSLSKENQLIYTTHSPFLVDPDDFSHVRAVYVDDAGETRVSEDLRMGNNATDAVYPVHAALGLNVSDTFLHGCKPILVEGVSDQHYLQAMKACLRAKGKYVTTRELVFIPTGGVKGVSPLTKLVGGVKGELPIVFLDSDSAGNSMTTSLRKNLYSEVEERVIQCHELLSRNDTEVEDMLPHDLVAKEFSKLHRGKATDFEDEYKSAEPIVPQMEEFLNSNDLPKPLGWKVELAKRVRSSLEAKPERGDGMITTWEKLFSQLLA